MRIRTLTGFGNGYLLGRLPATNKMELWKLQTDDSFGSEPQAMWSRGGVLSGSHLPVGLDESLLEYDQNTTVAELYRLPFEARGWGLLKRGRSFNLTWGPLALGGRNIIALDKTHVLSWQLRDGSYSIARYTGDAAAPFERWNGLGPKPTLRRGYRWLALERSRLLEWHPGSRRYQVWSYDLARLPGDIFASQALASGEWPELAEEHDLLLVAPGKLAIWNRDLGSVEVRSYDPLGPDPLGGQVLNVTQDDRFRSLRSGFEKPPVSNVRRLVLVLQQGRSFDAYFGRYCRAPSGSNPACEEGPDCCEAMPELVGVDACQVLNTESDHQPHDSPACLAEKLQAWADHRLVASATCGDPKDFACVDASEVAGYAALAAQGTLADRYFASVADSASNNLVASSLVDASSSEAAPAVTRLLAAAGVPFAFYLSRAASWSPLLFEDGSWIHLRSLDEFADDVATEQLPVISIVMPDPDDVRSEAPGEPASLSSGIEFTRATAGAVAASPRYAAETLVLIAHLSGGGFYDHVRPPAARGGRVPMLALGRFVRKNRVSHALFDHASLAAFIRWNWLGGDVTPGLLELFDPTTLGTPLP